VSQISGSFDKPVVEEPARAGAAPCVEAEAAAELCERVTTGSRDDGTKHGTLPSAADGSAGDSCDTLNVVTVAVPYRPHVLA
jgi:hypothetical protein